MRHRESSFPLLAVFLAAVCVWGVFAVVELAARRLLGPGQLVGLAGGLVTALALAILGLRGGSTVGERVKAAATAASKIPQATWLAACLGTGWLLRGLWILLLPPVQRSDWDAYLQLAIRLVERGEYQWHGISIYLPPGLPLTLAAVMKVVGVHVWVVWVINLLAFAAGLLATWEISRRLAGPGAARLATALLVAWPNLVFLAGLAMKENLTFALVPATVLLYLTAEGTTTGRRRLVSAFAAGMVLGWATLTQPSNLLLPTAFAAFEVRRRDGWRRAAGRLLPLALGLVLIVSGWTVRNWLRFGRFVPVAANGGHSLLVGNNPEADGGWIPIRDQHPHDDEIAYDRMALHMALTYMREHPIEVLRLVAPKQILFLGDDADGAYETLKRNHGIGDMRYLVAKGVSLAYWLALLALVAVALWSARRERVASDPRTELLILVILYFLALHSITESGGRHHIALAGLLAALAVLPAGSGSPQSEPPGQRRTDRPT